ncbi:hypothetical protein ACSBR2_031103 [Camellia fascicularis]
MKRSIAWDDQVDVILSDESSSSSDANDDGRGSNQSNSNFTIDQPPEEKSSEGLALLHHHHTTSVLSHNHCFAQTVFYNADMMIRRAQMYQNYMKQIPIPTLRGSVIPFNSWTGLSKSIKKLYGQPLHYLTNILLIQWDKMRIGGEDEDRPLDTIFHPCKAEANIWLIEEVHRRTTSHHHLAKLWLSDPMPHAFIDPIFPRL